MRTARPAAAQAAEAAQLEELGQATALEAQLLAAQVAMERLAVREAEAEHAALAAMQGYQEEALQVLQLGALAERAEEEAALSAAAAAALESGDRVAAAARGQAPPPVLRELPAIPSDGSGESSCAGSGDGSSGSEGAAQPPARVAHASAQRARPQASVGASAAAGASGGGGGRAAAGASSASGSEPLPGALTDGGGAGAALDAEGGKGWLRQIMDKLFVRDYWDLHHPVIGVSVVK